MKLKAKGGNEAVIEKFAAQSCKTAKYAKSSVKKRDLSEQKVAASNQDAASAAGGITVTSAAGDAQSNNANVTQGDKNTTAQSTSGGN